MYGTHFLFENYTTSNISFLFDHITTRKRHKITIQIVKVKQKWRHFLKSFSIIIFFTAKSSTVL